MNKNQTRYLVRWLIFNKDNSIKEFGAIGCESYERALVLEEIIRPHFSQILQEHVKNKFEIIQEEPNVTYEET